MIKETEIVIAPPLAGHRGSAWLSSPFENSAWACEFTFELGDFCGGGSFGVWITSHLGSAGEICGGPRYFRGLSVFGRLLTAENQSQYVQITAAVVDNEDVMKVNEIIITTAPIVSPKLNLSIRVSSKNGNLFTIAVKSDSVWIGMKEIEHPHPPHKWYVGVTAMNLKYYMCVSLTAVRFSRNTTFEESKGYVEMSRNPHIQFGGNTENSRWKSVRFDKLNEEAKRIGTPKSESNFSHLIEVMDEVNAAICDLASFREVNYFIRSSLQPHAQRWQKRAIKVVLYTYFIQESVRGVLSENHKLFFQFNQTVEGVTLQSQKNVNEISQIISDVSKQEDEEYSLFVDQVADEVVSRTLFYGSVAEVVLVAIFFAIVQFRRRNRVPRALQS